MGRTVKANPPVVVTLNVPLVVPRGGGDVLVAGTIARLDLEAVVGLDQAAQRHARRGCERAPGPAVETPGEGQVRRCRDRVAACERERRRGDRDVAARSARDDG